MAGFAVTRNSLQIRFSQMEWTDKGQGLRTKEHVSDGVRIRMLEITPDLVHPDWCSKAHAGYVLEGSFELRLPDAPLAYEKGDAFITRVDTP